MRSGRASKSAMGNASSVRERLWMSSGRLSVPGTVGKELRSIQTQRTLLAVNRKKAMKKTFSDKVRDIVRKIPKRKTMTYKEVASKAGNPKAARAVGAVMRSNYDPSIPCHRFVAS